MVAFLCYYSTVMVMLDCIDCQAMLRVIMSDFEWCYSCACSSIRTPSCLRYCLLYLHSFFPTTPFFSFFLPSLSTFLLPFYLYLIPHITYVHSLHPPHPFYPSHSFPFHPSHPLPPFHPSHPLPFSPFYPSFLSGDDGIANSIIRKNKKLGCSKSWPDWPASSAFVTAVGATQLSNTYAPACTSTYDV